MLPVLSGKELRKDKLVIAFVQVLDLSTGDKAGPGKQAPHGFIRSIGRGEQFRGLASSYQSRQDRRPDIQPPCRILNHVERDEGLPEE